MGKPLSWSIPEEVGEDTLALISRMPVGTKRRFLEWFVKQPGYYVESHMYGTTRIYLLFFPAPADRSGIAYETFRLQTARDLDDCWLLGRLTRDRTGKDVVELIEEMVNVE